MPPVKTMLFGLISFLLVYSFAESNHHHIPEIKYELTKEHQAKLKNKLGVIGMEKMKAVNCESSVAEYLHTGNWSDSWCHDSYQYATHKL